MTDFVGTPPIMKIALCVAMETPKNTISPWIFFEDFFFMKHYTFLILKLLIKFLKELVVGQGLFSAKSPCLFKTPFMILNKLGSFYLVSLWHVLMFAARGLSRY